MASASSIQTLSVATNTVYQNTNGTNPLYINVDTIGASVGYVGPASGNLIQVYNLSQTQTGVYGATLSHNLSAVMVVPPDWYYKSNYTSGTAFIGTYPSLSLVVPSASSLQRLSTATNTVYQNTNGTDSLYVSVDTVGTSVGYVGPASGNLIQVYNLSQTQTGVYGATLSHNLSAVMVVPSGWYYKSNYTGGTTFIGTYSLFPPVIATSNLQRLSTATNTVYQNTNGTNPLYINVDTIGASVGYVGPASGNLIQVYNLSQTQTGVYGATLSHNLSAVMVVPPDWYYKSNYTSGTAFIATYLKPGPLASTGWTASNSIADQNQYETLKAVVSGGTLAYTYNFLVYNSLGVLVANALYGDSFASSNTFSFPINSLWGTGAFTANLIVTDSSSPTNTVTNTLAFGVNSVLLSTSFTPFSQQITTGSLQAITADVSGGTAPYTYNFLVYSPGGALVDSSLDAGISQNSLSFSYAQSASWGTGTFTANVIVTDSATSSAEVTNTLSYVATSSPSPPPPTPPSPGNGGGTSSPGGGGIQKPTILNMPNGFLVLGIAPLNTFNLTVDGVLLNFTENYISPTDAGLTVNQDSYVLSPNVTTTIIQGQNPEYLITMKLVSISIIPLQNTISLEVLGTQKIKYINVTEQNFTSEVLSSNSVPTVINLFSEKTTLNVVTKGIADKIFSIRNDTGAAFLPPLPQNYSKQLIQNISFHTAPAQPKVNVTVGISISYNCSIPFYKIVPFILGSNFSWYQITSYTVMPKICVVMMNTTSDPVIALTQYIGSVNRTLPKTVTVIENVTPPPAPPTVNKSVTTRPKPQPPPVLGIVIAAVAAALVIVAILLYRRWKGKGGQHHIHLGRFMELRKGHEHRKHYQRGHELHQSGRLEEAIREYDRAIALKPGDPNVHIRKAMALDKLGRYREANEEYQKAIRLSAKH